MCAAFAFAVCSSPLLSSQCAAQRLARRGHTPLRRARWRCPASSRRCDRALVVSAQHSLLPHASRTIAVQAPPQVLPQRTSERHRQLDQPSAPVKPARYRVREVHLSEVYTVADIRCEAFYEHPKDPYFYPVRRREIHMAMRDRIDSGNKCLVVVDTQPPPEWSQFATDGELVVGSLDISLHEPRSGRKCQFLQAIFDRPAAKIAARKDGEAKRIYISSMAVREEWRGRGLAQLLLEYVDKLALRQGSREVFLHVELDNKRAVHVYNKCGFAVVPDDTLLCLPKWLHFITKAEHTLMHKKLQ